MANFYQMARAFARAATKQRQNPITRQINAYIDDPNTTRLIGSDDYKRGEAMAKERADKLRGRRDDGTSYKKPVTDIESINLSDEWAEAFDQAVRHAASMEVSPLRKLSDAHKALIDDIIDDVVNKRVSPADVTSQSGILENYPQLKDMEMRRKLAGAPYRSSDWRPRWIDGTPFKPWTSYK